MAQASPTLSTTSWSSSREWVLSVQSVHQPARISDLGSQALIQKTGIGGLLNYWYQVSRYFKDNDYDVVWLQNPFILNGNPFKRCLVTMHSTYYGSSTHGVGSLPFHLYKSLVAHVERYCLTHASQHSLHRGGSTSL
jgi:hypothetical protein